MEGDIVRLEIRNKDWISFLGTSPETVIAIAELPMPGQVNFLNDSWFPLMKPDTKATISAEIHLVMQLEDDSISIGNAVQPLPMRETPRKFSRHSSGEFDGKAAAATINELISSLEKVKMIIHAQDASSLETVLVQTEHDPNRLQQLRAAKTELESIQFHIESEGSLSKEWRQKLIELAASYSNDLTVLMSAQAWQNVDKRASVKMPMLSPALPPRPGRTITATKPVTIFRNVEPSKGYSISDLDMFDELLDDGVCVQVVETGMKSSPLIKKGDVVTLDYVAYIWDSAHCIAVAFDSTIESGYLTFVVGDEDTPRGLSMGVEGLVLETQAICTITPDLGFGDKGNELVPPETHLMYELKVIRHVPNSSDAIPDHDHTTPGTLQRQFSGGSKFAARENRASLALDPIAEPPITQDDLTSWLTGLSLQHYMEPLKEIGVEELQDLEHVLPEDLEAMGMRVIQIRKFNASVKKLGLTKY